MKVHLLKFQGLNLCVISESIFLCCVQAQLQRSLDSSVSTMPRAFIGRRSRREPAVSVGAGMDSGGQGGCPVLEQDSEILDVEDEEEDEEVRKLPPHTETHQCIAASLDLFKILFSHYLKNFLQNLCIQLNLD